MSKHHLARISAVAFLVITMAFGQFSSAFKPFNDALEAFRMKSFPQSAQGNRVLLEIDNRSLSEIGVWPWPRSIYAHIISVAFAMGAEEIAFDIDFSARSNEAEDAILAKALAEAAGPVTLAIFQQHLDSKMDAGAIQTNKPIAELYDNAWLSAVNVLGDSDGIVRRVPVAQQIDGELVPSMAATMGGYLNLTQDLFHVDFGIKPSSIPTFSIIDLLAGNLPTNALANKKVLIGAGAAELRDAFAVPVYGTLTGPQLQLVAAETLAQDRMLKHFSPHWGWPAAELIIFAICAWLILTRKLGIFRKLGCVLVLSVSIEAIGYLLYREEAIILTSAVLHAMLFGTLSLLVLFEVSIQDVLLAVSRKRSKSLATLLEKIVEDSFSGILICSKDGKILVLSQQARSLLLKAGYEVSEGQDWNLSLPKEFSALLCDSFEEREHSDTARELREISLSTGLTQEDEMILEYSITPSSITNDDLSENSEKQVATLIFQDITKARQEQRRIAYLADHDQLTNLLNKNGFCKAVDDAIESGAADTALIMMCKIRRHAKIAESLGSEYGDLLLQKIARQLEAVDQVAFVGINSQMEMMLCMLDVDCNEVEPRAEAILSLLNMPITLRGQNVIAAANLGMAKRDRSEHDTCSKAVRAARVALRRSQEVGDQFMCYSESLAADVLQRQTLEQEIIEALANKHFEMYYQPQADLETGEIVGCEALIRWNHETLGTIRPDLFIPIMEETGMIVELGRWILQKVSQDATKWPKDIPVAANVSAIQFMRSNVGADINLALGLSGLSRDRLQIEITESMFIANTDQIIADLEKIRSKSTKIALDDFGTGYSSLSYMHRFPLDKIKIDQSFVRGLPDSVESIAVINAVVALAQSFKLQIIAEGIETQEQATMLKASGCQLGQGWLYGKPMAQEDFISLLERQSPPPRRLYAYS